MGRAQVHMREVSPEGEEVIKTGKLYLVDLAGSENVNRCRPGTPFLVLQWCSAPLHHQGCQQVSLASAFGSDTVECKCTFCMTGRCTWWTSPAPRMSTGRPGNPSFLRHWL